MLLTRMHLFPVVMCVLLSLSGCAPSADESSPKEADPATGVVTVCTVNYPLKYFAERIGGEHVKALFLATPGEDPAYWRPDDEAIAAYQQADLVLLNGATYAKWRKTVSLPVSRVIKTSAACKDRYISVKEATTHSHGPGGEHAHTGTAFTTWLDPQIAVAQADAIRHALVKVRPQYETKFDDNFEALEADLMDLDSKIEKAVGEHKDRPILFSHPVYQYLQRQYDLNAVAVHWEPNEVPTDKMFEDLQVVLTDHAATWMVWEGTPAEESVQRLNALGIKSAVFDPCSKVPDDGDYLSIMARNVEELVRVYAK